MGKAWFEWTVRLGLVLFGAVFLFYAYVGTGATWRLLQGGGGDGWAAIQLMLYVAGYAVGLGAVVLGFVMPWAMATSPRLATVVIYMVPGMYLLNLFRNVIQVWVLAGAKRAAEVALSHETMVHLGGGAILAGFVAWAAVRLGRRYKNGLEQ